MKKSLCVLFANASTHLELPRCESGFHLLMQHEGVVDLDNVVEVLRVGNAEHAHAVSVACLLEVSVEGLTTAVYRVAADLTCVLHAQAVQLIHPVRDGLPVPAKRNVERVVDWPVVHLLLLLSVNIRQ